MSVDKSNFGSGIVDKENIEFLVFVDTLIDLIGFETFARATFPDFADFQSAFVASGQHFTNSIVDPIGNTLDPSGIFQLLVQRVLGHLHEPHGFVDILFFNSVNNT